jgi:hypothetical protein
MSKGGGAKKVLEELSDFQKVLASSSSSISKKEKGSGMWKNIIDSKVDT